MFIVPKERPSFKNLNSYYLDIDRLFEHFQGEYGAGCIHFYSSSHECIIFFDQYEILDGVFRQDKERFQGPGTVDRLNAASRTENFAIDVYEIDGEKIHLWATTPSAVALYKDLTTEFTDLKGLLGKMASEGLTGFIDIAIGKGIESGILFMMNGKICGGSYSWKDAPVGGTREDTELLISKAIESGSVLDVNRLSLESREGREGRQEDVSKGPSEIMKSLEELLIKIEDLVSANKGIKVPFSQILKKKFLEKADKYPFLDPFAAEFQYSSKRIRYTGDVAEDFLARGIKESVKEIAGEMDLLPAMAEILDRLH